MSSLEQIDKDYKLEPIIQPQLDIEAIEIPDNGPMSFEMDVEVRPQFDLPNYKGLKVKRPVAELTEKDVDDQLNRFLEGRGTIVPKLEGNAELGDYVTADLTFLGPDGEPLDEVKEIQFRLQPELRFQDGTIPGIGHGTRGRQPGRDPRGRGQARLGRRKSRAAGRDHPREGLDQRSEAAAPSRAERGIPRLDRLRQPRRAA